MTRICVENIHKVMDISHPGHNPIHQFYKMDINPSPARIVNRLLINLKMLLIISDLS